MFLTTKDQIKEYLNKGIEIMVIPYTEKVIDCSSAVFWKRDEKIFTWSSPFGTIERTDRTEEEILDHLASFLKDEDFRLNAAGH